MSHLRVSEIFTSIEGEGPYTGHPTLFVRFFGCNLSCPGFGSANLKAQPVKISYDKPETLDDLKDYVFRQGCDSAYSWHPSFKHLAVDYEVDELIEKLKKLVSECDSAPRILCFTGGEPLLYGRYFQRLWSALQNYFETLLIETNGTLPLPEDLDLKRVSIAYSPKLSNSGEPREKTLKPLDLTDNSYLKFVTDGSDESIAEIFEYIDFYTQGVVDYSELIQNTYLMPEGATGSQQRQVMQRVAAQCLKHGFLFCARVHVWVYGNSIGT